MQSGKLKIMPIDHTRGLCGKSNVNLNENKSGILSGKIIPKCQCCNSRMRMQLFTGGAGLTLFFQQTYIFICDNCTKYHQEHSQILNQATCGAP